MTTLKQTKQIKTDRESLPEKRQILLIWPCKVWIREGDREIGKISNENRDIEIERRRENGSRRKLNVRGIWGIGIRWGDDFDKGRKVKFKYIYLYNVWVQAFVYSD